MFFYFGFFTVYGPWGRPDMAPFKFIKKIINSDSIDFYNQGDMRRDFTYIGDRVTGMRLSIDAILDASNSLVDNSGVLDSKSFVAPYRI